MVLSKDEEGDGLFSKTIRVWTKGSTSDPGPVGMNTFASIGSPRDVRVHETSNGFLVTWDPPEYGVDELRSYVVQWFKGPEEYLHGSGETTNTSFLGTHVIVKQYNLISINKNLHSVTTIQGCAT